MGFLRTSDLIRSRYWSWTYPDFPDHFSLDKTGIPAKILKVSNTGRHKIIDAECSSGKIKALSHSSKEIPSGSIFLSFNQKYTYAYGDSWIIE